MIYYSSFVVLLQTLFVLHTVSSQNASLPPSEFPKDNLTYTIYSATKSKDPPLVFPENDPNYKIIQNTTILKSLVSQGSQKTDTEVPDLIAPIQHNETSPDATANQTVTNATTLTNSPDFDVENNESDVSKTEDVKLNSTFTRQSEGHENHEHTSRGGGPMVQGQLAAVLAGVFALIAVVAYIGLLTWRRYLEHRYGNREMLINEEEQINYNDMKNFEL